MKFSADYRALALDALRGRWKTAVLAGLIASLLGANIVSSSDRVISNMSQNANGDTPGFAGLFSTGSGGVLAVDVASPKAVRRFECFAEGLQLFWEGTPQTLYRYDPTAAQNVPISVYDAVEHDSRYSDNIVENAYVDELTNFFAVLKGEESPKWSFEKDLKAIKLMDKIEEA